MVRRKLIAQAATELAVFGAILIFVIGAVIRVAAETGMEQNASLKAMRWAMIESLKGNYNVDKSRISASVLYIEDRLSPDAGRFGSTERSPQVHVASATFGNTMFLPMDWLEYHNIPVTDVFVNGEHFVFSLAAFVVYDVQLLTAADGDPGYTAARPVRVWNLTDNKKKWYPKEGVWEDACANIPVLGPNGKPLVPAQTTSISCPIFYNLLAVNSANFCTSSPCTDDSPLSIDQRFDLNRNRDYTDDSKDLDTVTWQWSGVKGFVQNPKLQINIADAVYPSFDIDQDRKDEAIYGINNNLCNALRSDPKLSIQPRLIHPSLGANCKPGCTNQAVDCPGVPAIKSPAIVQRLYVVDNQEGDMDLSMDDLDELDPANVSKLNVGMQKDMNFYTFIQDGTYLEIKQGKAYVPDTGEFVRSANKRNQVDIISRMFQLSKDTSRYCDTNYVVNGRATPLVTPIGDIRNGLPNPVEVCVDSVRNSTTCFSAATVSKTCFDQGTNMFYIRSRLLDTRGRKWITQTK